MKDNNVMLILCGSFIGMMQKHALSYERPLYGLRTAQIRLLPLAFPDVYSAQQAPFEKAVEQYAITGGVPKYLEFFQSDKDLLKQIKVVVLSKNGFLYEEPNFLLKDKVQSATNYFSIIKTIADGNHKLGKIAGVLRLESSALTPYLSTLGELGFITKSTPITEKNPEKSRKGLYFITDSFIRFWFRYVYPYKGELELDNMQIVIDEIGKDFIQNFVAFSYEDICKSIFDELCKKQAIAFTPSRIGFYWFNDFDNDTQIDVAAVDHQHKLLFVGECKYLTKPVDVPVYYALEKKVRSLADIHAVFKDYGILYGIFSKSGFTQRAIDQSRNNQNLLLINEDNIL